VQVLVVAELRSWGGLHERARAAERRATEIDEEAAALNRGRVTEEEVEGALAAFDPVWEALAPREQARVVGLLVERVDFDGPSAEVSVTFRPTGIRALADELAGRAQGRTA
jgi:site-specific DNA recombinase